MNNSNINTIEYNVTYITDADYLTPNTNISNDKPLSFADKLALELNNADSKCTMNMMHANTNKATFEWQDAYAAN